MRKLHRAELTHVNGDELQVVQSFRPLRPLAAIAATDAAW